MRAIEKQYGGIYDAVIQQRRRHGHRISLTTPGQPKLQSGIPFRKSVTLERRASSSAAIFSRVSPGSAISTAALRPALVSLRGLAMYRGYIAHRALGHIAHIGADIDILPSILCVYQYSTYLLYIANLVCIPHHIRKSGIILPSYRFYIYITWYVVTCPHITG